MLMAVLGATQGWFLSAKDFRSAECPLGRVLLVLSARRSAPSPHLVCRPSHVIAFSLTAADCANSSVVLVRKGAITLKTRNKTQTRVYAFETQRKLFPSEKAD